MIPQNFTLRKSKSLFSEKKKKKKIMTKIKLPFTILNNGNRSPFRDSLSLLIKKIYEKYTEQEI